MSAPLSAKALVAALELLRNEVRAGKSLDEAITETMQMVEDWGSRDGELRRSSGEKTEKAFVNLFYYERGSFTGVGCELYPTQQAARDAVSFKGFEPVAIGVPIEWERLPQRN